MTALQQFKTSASSSSSGLGRVLAFYIVLASAVLSTLATGVQLYIGYQRDSSLVLGDIAVIDRSFSEGFKEALWGYDFGLVDVLLDGVYNRADVEFVELLTPAGKTWTRGEPSSELMANTLSFTKTNKKGKEVVVGELTIGLSFENAKERVWAQLWTVMVSNFAKTTLVSVIILALFRGLVTRHLAQIAIHVANTSWLKGGEPLLLTRSKSKSSDELDHIVSAINKAKTNSIKVYNEITAEVKQRKAAESALALEAATLESTNMRLTQANKEQAEFTYAVSHDLKTPTNTISMLLDEAIHSCNPETDTAAIEMIQLAQQTNKRMGSLVEDVLGYSMTVSDDMQQERVDAHALMEEILQASREEIETDGGRYELEQIQDIVGNVEQLRILFQNLIANAAKFRSSERPLLIRIASSESTEDGTVYFRVSDNGIGIPEAHHEKIFGLFKRLHGHEEYSGSGVGLTLCKRVVNNHGGEIKVESSESAGTTFTISLRQ